mgnify:CR=1 FL=1
MHAPPPSRCTNICFVLVARAPPFSSGAIVVMFMDSWGNPPPTALIVRRWTVVMAARGPWHHRDGRRCASRSAMAIRSFPGAVLPPSIKERLLLAWEQWWPWLGCARAGIRAWWRRCNRRRAIPWAQTDALAKDRTPSGNNGSVAIRSVSDPPKAGSVIFLAKRRFGWNPHKVDQGSA